VKQRLTIAPLRLTLLVAVVAMLGGCGPGVGGTGTGAPVSGGTAFGAVAAPVCLSAIAPALRCPGADVMTSAIADGTARTVFVDQGTGGQTTAQFVGNGVDLDSRCLALRFTGEWGVINFGQAAYYGTVLRDGATSRQAARMTVAADLSIAGAPRLTVELLATDGTSLSGRLVLRPQAPTEPAPVACP
jgi:hypothetical protein